MPKALAVRVTGEAFIEPSVKSFHAATFHVYVEDVSLVDTSAKQLATRHIRNVSHQQGEATTLPFSISFAVHDRRSDHIVRAHISMTGNQDIEQGDLLTVQSYPVPFAPHVEGITLHLRELI